MLLRELMPRNVAKVLAPVLRLMAVHAPHGAVLEPLLAPCVAHIHPREFAKHPLPPLQRRHVLLLPPALHKRGLSGKRGGLRLLVRTVPAVKLCSCIGLEDSRCPEKGGKAAGRSTGASAQRVQWR